MKEIILKPHFHPRKKPQRRLKKKLKRVRRVKRKKRKMERRARKVKEVTMMIQSKLPKSAQPKLCLSLMNFINLIMLIGQIVMKQKITTTLMIEIWQFSQ
jgi:hypothetical protein